MGLKGRGGISIYRDRVELFAPSGDTDSLGYETDEKVSIGIFDASVEEMTGGRELRYQAQGYSHPIQVKMYRPLDEFTTIGWNGSLAAVRSVVVDRDNNACIVIYADLKTKNPL